MSIQNDKLMNLQDGQVLYNDLRDRIEDTKLNATLSTPAPIVSFPDGAPYPMSLTAAIDPVQDLHGYANPWPAGGGKNLMPLTLDYIKSLNTGTWNNNQITSNGVVFTVNTDNAGNVISINANASSAATASAILRLALNITIAEGNYIGSGCPASGSGSSYYILYRSKSGNDQYDVGTTGAPFSVDSGNIFNMCQLVIASGYQPINKVFYPMIRLATETDPTFAPYSNICPITGFDGANVTVTGFNQWDEEWELGTYDGSTGAKLVDSTHIRCKNLIRVLPGTTYYLYNASGKNLFKRYYDSNKNFIEGTTGQVSGTFTTPAGTCYMAFHLADAYGTTYNNDICINVSDTSKNGTYEAYVGRTYPITFPTSAGTVYGGKVTVNPDGSGELVVDKGCKRLGDLTWTYESQYTRFSATIEGAKIVSGARTGYVQTENYQAIMDGRGLHLVPDGSIYQGSLAAMFYIHDSRYTDANTFSTAMSDEKILYNLANKVTYPLSAPQVIALLNLNHVWADTGYIKALSYVRNTVPEMIRQDTAGQIAEFARTADFSTETVPDPDTVPYIFRQTGDIGNKDGLKEKLIGGTVAWNQQLKSEINNINSTTSSKYGAVHTNRSSVTVNDNTNEFTFTSLQNTGTSGIYFNKPNAGAPLHDNHVYMQSCYVKAPKSFNFIIGTYGNQKRFNSLTSNTYVYVSCIVNFASTDNEFVFNFNASNSWDGTETVYIKNIQLIDVTQVFGSTIADALYAMETASAGSGVAWFRNLFPDDYYAYNPGELMSVKTSGHRTTGRNLCTRDTTSNIYNAGHLIPVRAGDTVYVYGEWTYTSNQYMFVALYSDPNETNKNNYTYNLGTKLSGVVGSYEIPADGWLGICYNAGVATYTVTKMMISFNQFTVNDYEPYTPYLYPIDPIDMRGIPQITDGVLSYDGDTYEPDGTLTRKYGMVDLGNLTYTYANSCMISETLETSGSNTGIGGSNNVVCTKYTAKSARHYSSQYADKECGLSETGTQIIIKDSAYTDAATFKTAMSGVYLVYELATPVIESAEPFDAAQKVDPDGTLEYIDERAVPIPVGHDGVYGHYLRMKGEDAPTRDTVKELIAPVQEELTDTESSIAIVIEGNVAPTGGLASGKYIYLKSHSTLARGLYHTTAAIATGASITENNTEPDDEGIANALSLVSGYDISGTVSVADGTVTLLKSLTVPKTGRYLIIRGCSWESNAVGDRMIIGTNSATPSRSIYDRVQATASGWAINRYTNVETLTAGNAINVYGVQYSGSTLNAYPFINYAKL